LKLIVIFYIIHQLEVDEFIQNDHNVLLIQDLLFDILSAII